MGKPTWIAYPYGLGSVDLYELASKPILDYLQAMHGSTISVVPFNLDKDVIIWESYIFYVVHLTTITDETNVHYLHISLD